MLRRFARSTIARGLHRSGLGGMIGRLSGASAEPLILGYHRVFPDAAASSGRGVPSMGIRVSTLEKHLEFVGRNFQLVSLDEMGRHIEEGTASGRAAVTFDDGYLDFYENAFPLLQRLGIPASVFVVTDLVENAGGFLHDRLYEGLDRALSQWEASRLKVFLAERGVVIDDLPERAFEATRTLLRSLDHDTLLRACALLDYEFGKSGVNPRSMNWNELRHMSHAGITVGSHTKTHTLLPHETASRVAEETKASRLKIEAELGAPVRHFVYPDGCFNTAAVRAVAAAGYRYGYTGCKHRDPEYPLLTLPRRVLWEGSTVGTHGAFSVDVLSGQINGIFDLTDRCSDDHKAGSAPVTHAVHAARVAVVAPGLETLGGQSIQADALVRGLREDGFPVFFVPTNPRFPKGLRSLRRVPVLRTLVNQALYASNLLRLRHADVVHVFSASFWSFLLAPAPAMLIARFFGKRVVLNYHSGEAAEHLADWGPLVHPWLRLPHEIVVPSAYLREIFAEHGYRSRVVRNVVDTSRFTYRSRSPLRPRLLSTRNLEPIYRVDVVLDAFALLKKECPEATLVVAGSGSEETRLRRMAESIGGITFVGRVAPESMPQLCAAADIFLNASVVDNQPLSLLESLASGLPVVTTAPGDIAAMVRHGESGLIVPALDPAAMAAAALFLLRDPQAATRIARGGREVAETHSWARVRGDWADVYVGSGGTAGTHQPAPAGGRLADAFVTVDPAPMNVPLRKEHRC